MDTPREEFYDKPETEVWILFDHRGRGGITRLWRQRRAWGPRATVENLGHGRAVLMVSAGGAKDLTA